MNILWCILDAWFYVEGGMGGLSNSVASSARSLGVEIRTDCAVKHIAVRQSKVTGVVLENGDEIQSNLVASNANAFLTFAQLLPNEVYQNNEEIDRLRKTTEKINYSSGTTKINLALSGLP